MDSADINLCSLWEIEKYGLTILSSRITIIPDKGFYITSTEKAAILQRKWKIKNNRESIPVKLYCAWWRPETDIDLSRRL